MQSKSSLVKLNDYNFQEGNLVEELVIYISRPYPVATVGVPYRLTFDIKTKIFEYQFYPDTTKNYPTEIFVPPLHYPSKSYSVETSKNLKWSRSKEDKNKILVYFAKNAGSAANVEYVRILPL